VNQKRKRIVKYNVKAKKKAPLVYRTFIHRPVVRRMILAYDIGLSMRELARRWHYAIPIVKRTLLGAGVKLKPQGRPRKIA
jgi:hypothetical protein